MIERLIENHDLKKVVPSPNLKSTLNVLFDKKDFVEIVQDRQLLIGIKDKNNNEVLHIEDTSLLEFLRSVRDDFYSWNEIVQVRRSAHKQFLANLQKSRLFDFISKRYDNNILNDSIKISKKIYDYNNKIKLLHERLQGVFLVQSKKKDLVNGFDNKESIVVCKTSLAFDANELCWIKEAKYATVLVICPEDNFVHKFLKSNGMEKLTLDKKKCKNIWIKNHK